MNLDRPGESDLIDWISRHTQHFPSSIIKNIGDDCAVFDPRFTPRLAVTTDMLLEDVHFRRRWISPYFLGRKSLAVNLSDLAAVGAVPYACLLSLALPPDLTSDYFHSFMKGFLEEGECWHAPLIGGDLSRSEKIYVSVTAWGSLQAGDPVWRSQGQDGDKVVLVGEIGLARVGLEILQQEDPSQIWKINSENKLAQWAGDSFRYRCLKAHLLPKALVQVGSWLCRNRLANAMIDISDGLASDLFHIACQSQLVAEIEVEQLPLPEQAIGQLDPLEAALNGGEDHALIFTASQEQLDRLSSSYPTNFPPYRVIGKLSGGEPSLYLKRKGKQEKYEPRGFNHFR